MSTLFKLKVTSYVTSYFFIDIPELNCYTMCNMKL